MINLFRKYLESVSKVTGEVGIIEFGIDSIRLDALLVNCHKRRIRGFEFKQNRNDFLQDKKWQNYLKYCNTFTFICPPNIIFKNELPQGIGLIYIEERTESEGLNFVTNTKENHALYYQRIKRVNKSNEVGKEIYIQVISLMLNRVKYRKEALF